MTLTREEFLSYVDHTMLKPEQTYDEVVAGVEYAAEVGAKAVCVTPHRLDVTRGILAGTDVIIGTVVGFPNGTQQTVVKAYEAERCHEAGATELDMVIDIGALVSGDEDRVRDDIRAVVEASPAHVKVILETAYLTDEQILRGAAIVSEAGAAFVKTSTGFASSGASPEGVALLRRGAAPETRVKAAGGIRSLAEVEAVIEAGADRLGLSRTKDILAEIG